jgi:long-chain fatty acid transport protein
MPDDEPSRYHVTRALFLASRATLSAAYRVTPQFSIGASVHLIYVYLKAKRTLNLLVLQDPDRRFDDPKTTSTHELDSTLNLDGQDWTWGWDVGVLFTPLDTFRIGASIASGSAIGLDGDVKLTHPDGKVERARQHTFLAIPLTLRAGFNWEFAPDFQLAADVYWWHYQVMQEQRTTLSKPIAGIREFVDPKNYGNCWQWNAGLSYRLLPRLELSAGFQMDGSPIPSATYTLDNPTTKQYGIGLGGRWQVTDKVRLGFAIVRNWFQLLEVQDNVQNPPSNIKGHGSNFEFGFDVDWRI